MAFGKTAGCLIVAAAAFAAQFPVRHEHLRKGCEGIMTADETGVQFGGSKTHAWSWLYEDIQELRLEPGKIRILTYKDDKLRLGADREYAFTGSLPGRELYELWKRRMDQRFVAALPETGTEEFEIPVKHLKRITGSEGTLAFGEDSITFSTDLRGDSRTWRYSDIDSISSSGPFQLTITTFERAKSHYGDRKGFNFELKQPITEAKYNEVWLQIEKKNGRIQ
jgi:glycerophosphoryl diester phosphodiesterase